MSRESPPVPGAAAALCVHLQGILSVGLFQCPPVSAVPPSLIRDGCEYLELLTDGVVYDGEAGPERQCGPGMLFWHVAGDHTVFRTRPDAPYRCLCIHFSVNALRRPVPHRTEAGDAGWARALAHELITAFHDPACDRQALALYAYSRLLWAARVAPAADDARARPPAVRRLLALLEEEPKYLVAGVDALATALAISRSHLHLLCQRHLHTSPHRLLLERRLGAAKRLLAGSQLPIKAVAAECGFDNVECFYQAFSRVAGIPPGQYRQQHTHPR